MPLWEHSLKNAYIGEYRVPWENTIAYYPLTADTNDAYWDNNMTNSGIVFWKYNWVQCAYLNNNAYASKSWSLFTWNPTFTVSVWMNNIDTNNGEIPWSFWSNWAQTQQFLLRLNGSTRTLNVWWYQNDRDTWYVINRNTWYNVIFAYRPSWWTVYVNWESVYSWTWSPAIWNSSTRISGDQWGWQLWYWYLSELIFENKKWTIQKAKNYYNSTKSNYWL